WDFDALARVIILPAVVGTAQTVFLVAPEPQGHTAMRAKLVDQSMPPFSIAKRQQPLRQQFDAHRWAFVVGQLLRQQGRDPVAAEQPAAGSAGPSLGQQIVVLFPQHRMSSSGEIVLYHTCGAVRGKPRLMAGRGQ